MRLTSGSEKTWSAAWPLAIGSFAILILIGGLGLWSVGTEIAGAVVASGTVKVEAEQQVVQHPDGGVVTNILARDGDAVLAGAILIEFDDTFLRSELEIVERQLLEVLVRRLRLEAERDGVEQLEEWPYEEFQTLDPGWVNNQIFGQRNLFAARAISLNNEVEQLTQQIDQVGNQIVGIEAQTSALQDQLVLVDGELKDLILLLEQGLVQASRAYGLQREQAQLKGDIGQLYASLAESRGRISSISIEIIKLSNQRREEAITRLRDLRYSEIELVQTRLSLKQRLSRLEVRSPVDGVVFSSSVFSQNSVVRPAEPIMFVVPKDQPMQVSARIDPVHIEQVFAGQPVFLRFTTYDQRTTPEIAGEVLRISADVIADEATGITFYEAILLPDLEELLNHPEIRLLPGMPVEAFLKTEDRTPLSYLMQPLTNYFRRAFREE